MAERVLVVGAGLSGLAAALDLARAGVAVTLAERRPFAGGRTYSFVAPDGDVLDNGQHVFLGCCTQYLRFLRDIGARDLVALQWRTKVPFIDARTGRTSWMKATPLVPAPFHLLASMLLFAPLSWAERTSAMKLGREMIATDRAELDDVTMGQWLRERGQSPNAVKNFWEISVLAVLNERVDRVSAAAGLFFFQEGFFRAWGASRVGYPKVGLGIIADRAVAAIRKAGGEVKLGTRVERLEGYDYYIPAVPAKALLELVPRDEFFGRCADMPTSPIVNVHVKFDRPVWGRPFAAVVGSPLQWIFNHSRITGQSGGGTRIAVSVSGARDLMDESNESIGERFVGELKRVLPEAREAIARRVTVVREPEATFVAAPGTRAKRLPCETPIPNVFLAGEWTESEWPSTMEAAVRSGRRAAAAVLARVQDPESRVQGPL